MSNYLTETPILNFSHPVVREVLKRLEVDLGSEEEKPHSMCDFVKNDMKFGFTGGCNELLWSGDG